MVGHQLRIILIRRSHIDLITCFLTLLGERTDNVIRFKTRHFQHGYIHRFEQSFDDRHRFADIFRCLRSLRFILLIRFVAERATGRVKSNTYMRRIDFLEQIFQRDGKTENSGRVLALTVHSRRTDKSVVRTENHCIGINQKKLLFHLRLDDLRFTNSFHLSLFTFHLSPFTFHQSIGSRPCWMR